LLYCGRELSWIVSYHCVESYTCKQWTWYLAEVIYKKSVEGAHWLFLQIIVKCERSEF
jgi:hypothetical protein